MSKWIKIEDLHYPTASSNLYEIGYYEDRFKDESKNGFIWIGYAVCPNNGGNWITVGGRHVLPNYVCKLEKNPFDAEVEVKKVYSEDEVLEIYNALYSCVSCIEDEGFSCSEREVLEKYGFLEK